MAAAAGWYGRKRTRELALIVCFLAPSLAIFLLYRLIPLGWNVVLSFQSWSPMRPARWVGRDDGDFETVSLGLAPE